MSAIHATSTATKPDQTSALTARALILGASLTVLATIAGSYARYVLNTTRLDQNHLSVAAVFPLFLIALFLARPFKINRGEMIVIFTMGLIGATMPTYFIGRMLAFISVPYYGASPENQWAFYFSTYLPSWAIVPAGEGLRWYYEGLPPGASIPWQMWMTPVFWWTTVIAAFYGCCLCITVILRKQWVEHERITYPLMTMPLALVEKSEPQNFFPIPVMNRTAFWYGFGISAFIILWNINGYFSTTFPTIPWHFPDIQFGPMFPPIYVRLYPLIVGFGYFINQDIAFSLWFFNLITNLEIGFFNTLGYSAGGSDAYGTYPLAVGAQSMGAFTAIVFVGLYHAREHLRNVFRKAFKRDPNVDDSDEVMSYRVAVFGLIACTLYLVFWHYATGMAVHYIPIFMLGVLILFLGMTRVIIETGVLSIRAPLMPQELAAFTWGNWALPQQNMVGLALSYAWCGDLKTTIMPALAHTTKLYDGLPVNRRKLLWAILIAMVVGVIATFIFTIYIRYHHGGVNTGALKAYPWNYLVSRSRSPFDTRWPPLKFILWGIVVTYALMQLRYRFPLGPFHPVGFAAGPVYPLNIIIVPIFIAWFLKLMILKIGGFRTLHGSRPFFIGLILGHFVGAGISFIVDMIWFPGQGHPIPFSD